MIIQVQKSDAKIMLLRKLTGDEQTGFSYILPTRGKKQAETISQQREKQLRVCGTFRFRNSATSHY